MPTDNSGAWKDHVPWFLGVVFTSGLLYSQVNANSNELKNRSKHVDLIAVHQVMLDNHQRLLERIEQEESANNEQFLNKLDQVIDRLDKRDATQTEAIQALTVEVSVIKTEIQNLE